MHHIQNTYSLRDLLNDGDHIDALREQLLQAYIEEAQDPDQQDTLLIREAYFVTWVEEDAIELGDVAEWSPVRKFVDWAGWAALRRNDFEAVTLDGITYLYNRR